MTLFKSPTRIKAEKLRAELSDEQAEVTRQINEPGTSLKDGFSILVIRYGRLKDMIGVLDKVLTK